MSDGEKPEAITVHTLMRVLECAASDRLRLGRTLGQSYNNQRDMYDALGWPKTVDFDAYWGKFMRNSIAGRVVDAYPEATWATPPKILDGNDEQNEDTPFTTAWKRLVKRIKFFNKIKRADIIAGVGQYGILMYGFNDNSEWDKPVTPSPGLDLVYVQPYAEGRAKILEKVKDRKDPRFGKPLYYEVKPDEKTTLKVHFSRCLHMAEHCLESDTYAAPRMEPVYNELVDLEKICGGSAEMFWRGAFPGYSFEADADADMAGLDTEGMQEQIEKFVHKLERYMKLQGVKVNTLSPTVSDPTHHYDLQINNISARTRIPRRILTGSERGQLASDQDAKAWYRAVSNRRINYAEPMILDEFLNDMGALGILEVPEDYEVLWPELSEMDEGAHAENMRKLSETLARYLASGGDAIIPPAVFLEDFMGMSKKRVESFMDYINEQLDKEDEEAAEAAKFQKIESEEMKQNV
jgi:hypothetical protein